MTECRRIRRAILARRTLAAAEEAHLFACGRCRRHAHAERLLGLLAGSPTPPREPSEEFISKVMSRIATADRPSRNAAVWTWAAAAALFAFGVGYGSRAAQTVSENVDSVAELTPTSAASPLDF
jgi:hypothetical protein